MRSSLKPAWIAIALLAVLLTAMTVQACTPVPSQHAAAPRSVAGGSAGILHQPGYALASACTREALVACENACMMPGGILDLYCYEDCVYSVC